jgi:hypothetical protein
MGRLGPHMPGAAVDLLVGRSTRRSRLAAADFRALTSNEDKAALSASVARSQPNALLEGDQNCRANS